MNRRFRLLSSSDFRRVRRTGKSYAHPLFVLIAAPNHLERSRFGISASRAVGIAVARNRAKRRLRAAATTRIQALRPGWDLVLIARPALLQAPWERVEQAIDTLLAQAKVLED